MLNKSNLVGKNKEDLINSFLEENSLSEQDIYVIENETEEKLFSKKYSIDIVTKQDVIGFIKDYFKALEELMGVEIGVEVRITDTEENDIYNVLLITNNNAIMIGKEGRTLDAMQTLLRQSISNNLPIKVNLDASNYKAKKNKNLEYEAKKLAREVLKTKVDVKLDPMTSFERRIVHNVVNKYDNLATESEGETPNRYVVIKYKED